MINLFFSFFLYYAHIRAPRATSKISSLSDNVDASWSPNGCYIVTANYNNQLSVFDTKESKLIKKANLLYEVSNSDQLYICIFFMLYYTKYHSSAITLVDPF